MNALLDGKRSMDAMAKSPECHPSKIDVPVCLHSLGTYPSMDTPIPTRDGPLGPRKPLRLDLPNSRFLPKRNAIHPFYPKRYNAFHTPIRYYRAGRPPGGRPGRQSRGQATGPRRYPAKPGYEFRVRYPPATPDPNWTDVYGACALVLGCFQATTPGPVLHSSIDGSWLRVDMYVGDRAALLRPVPPCPVLSCPALPCPARPAPSTLLSPPRARCWSWARLPDYEGLGEEMELLRT